MNCPKAIVLVSTCGYSEEYEPLLRQILDEKADVFCTVGVNCAGWEDAMDWLCVSKDVSGEIPGAYITTTSHPNESLEEVVEFAKKWDSSAEQSTEVKIIRI